MLFAQGVVNLALKLHVRVHLTRPARRRVHFHIRPYRLSAARGHGASVGFCGTTYEVMLAPSFEGERSFAVKKKQLQRKKTKLTKSLSEMDGRLLPKCADNDFRVPAASEAHALDRHYYEPRDETRTQRTDHERLRPIGAATRSTDQSPQHDAPHATPECQGNHCRCMERRDWCHVPRCSR